MSEENEQPWEEIHRMATLIDLHAHPSLKAYTLGRELTRFNRAASYFSPFSVRTDFKKLDDGNVDILFSAIYAPEKELLEDIRLLRLLKFLRLTRRNVFSDRYFELTISMLDQIEKIVNTSKRLGTERPWAKMARSVSELEAVLEHEDKPIAIIHSVEGAHSLDGSLENLVKLFDRGVAYLTLAHFYSNIVVHPVFPFPEYAKKFVGFRRRRDLTKGLTSFGQQVVQRMVELGMLIDITHCTPQARKEIYDIVGRDAPLIASHIGAFEINPNPYNLQDWEIRKIARTGGVVGVIFMNYWLAPHERKRGIDYILQTIKHLVDKGGVNHVALGSDLDGFTDPPDDIKDASKMSYLTQRLVAEDFTKNHIYKILGENVLRVLRKGWKK